ncbi:MAG TPA: glutamine amidotransferase [Polyangia bacterium]|nr:glutamine amidotransferase [Polyangia bacterium]
MTNLLLTLPAQFNEWHLTLGASAHLGRLGVVLLMTLAALAIALSALSLIEERFGRGGLLLLLRAAGVLACLATALEPTIEQRQVAHVPNHVAVVVDTSRSMDVRPPDGGPSRAERARALLDKAAPTLAAWERDGHRVDLYSFGEALAPATLASLGAAPAGDATRIGEALGDLRARYAGRDLGGVVIVSDGVDTGRIGEGPLDATTRADLAAMDVPVNTVGVGESSLRDLSVAAVLADDFAFVRTPVTIEAVIRQTGLADRQIDVTLTRDGRPIANRGVVLRGAHSEERVSFDWLPDHPGTFVFRIATPVLGGEALTTNNEQTFTVKVIRDRIRVLHLCGRPSWDERFLRAMLRRDPNVDLVSFFILRTETDEQPWNREELSLIPFPTFEIFEEQLKSFDLVIFQNFNFAPYGVEPFLPGVRDYVESGGAIAMVGGDLSFGSGGYGLTPLADVLPVELPPTPPALTGAPDPTVTTDAFKPRLTPEGLTHPVTSLLLDPRENELRWGRLPALEGINRVPRARAGATTLLAHPTLKGADGKPAPVLVAGDAGKGRALAFLTDTGWHWGLPAAGEGDDGRAFQRFWENAIRWLVRDPALTLLRIELDRVEYRRNQPPVARVRAMHGDYSAAANVEVSLDLRGAETAADAKPLRTLMGTTNGDGEAQIDLGALQPGAYRVSGRATVDGHPVAEDKTFVVRAEGRELDDVAARDKVLREIAAVSGGDYRFEDFGHPPVRAPREVHVGRQRSVELWSSPFLLILGIALLTTEWYLRRRAGHS